MYDSPTPWSATRPRVLVIACSDGRFEKQLDDFLLNRLNISQYDRLYLPGGPGALASSGFEFNRVDQARWECRFLLEAHKIEEAILIFHSGSAGGSEEAMCADYRRKLPARTTDQLRTQQELDAQEVKRLFLSWPGELHVRIYRGEVDAENRVRFVEL